MNILNGNEAFTALMAGKKIMCRAVDQLVDFNDLDQFPATIFAMPGYEFSIKIDLIEVAGITFTKPLMLDEYQDGQDVFVICTYGPSVYVVNFKTSVLIESINSGFVQRDAENAKLQLQAMCKALGRELDGDCSVVRLGEDPSKSEKKRQSRKKTDTSVTIADVEPSCVESTDLPWEDKAKEDELVKPTQAITIIAQENVTTSEDSLVNETVEQVELDSEHQERLNTILNGVANAQTPVEVNAHIRYTKSWTEQQRHPVIQAMNKRLIELKDQKEVDTEQPPSLMVQIQNTQDEHELNELLPEIRSRRPDIQPKLMDLVKKRRFELENQGSQVAS